MIEFLRHNLQSFLTQKEHLENLDLITKGKISQLNTALKESKSIEISNNLDLVRLNVAIDLIRQTLEKSTETPTDADITVSPVP